MDMEIQSVTQSNKFTGEHATCAKGRAAALQPCSLLNVFRGMNHNVRSLCISACYELLSEDRQHLMTLTSNLSHATCVFF